MRVPKELINKRIEFVSPMRNRMVTSYYYSEEDIKEFFKSKNINNMRC